MKKYYSNRNILTLKLKKNLSRGILNAMVRNGFNDLFLKKVLVPKNHWGFHEDISNTLKAHSLV